MSSPCICRTAVEKTRLSQTGQLLPGHLLRNSRPPSLKRARNAAQVIWNVLSWTFFSAHNNYILRDTLFITRGGYYRNWHSRPSAFHWTNSSCSSKIVINSHITIEFDFILRYIFPWFRILCTNVRLRTVKWIVPVTEPLHLRSTEFTSKPARVQGTIAVWGLGRPFGLKGTRYEGQFGHTATCQVPPRRIGTTITNQHQYSERTNFSSGVFYSCRYHSE